VGTELLAAGSVIAAFLAGGVALFAPCCIVFLAPSYLAGAVKNRRWRLLPLTFIFAAGLATILVPLTLGASLLAGAIAQYHQVLYIAGGALMLMLAVFTLTGRMWSLPSFIRTPDTAGGDSASFFSLGVFSGIASACCAPVLVGVMALSAIAANPAGGLVLGVAYVFGMVFPLFLMALLWDTLRLNERKFWRAKPVRFTVKGHTLHTNTLNIIVAAGFAAMGVAIIALANQTDMTGGTAAQSAIAEGLTDFFLRVQDWVSWMPEVVQAGLLFAVAGIFVWATLVGRRRRPQAPSDNASPESGEPAPALADTSTDGTDSSCHDERTLR
jgi:cytochrome c biogenesis protein CcdA